MATYPAELEYGFGSTSYGQACVAFAGDILYALIFEEKRDAAVLDLKKRWKTVTFREDPVQAEQLLVGIFEKNTIPELALVGTDFQKQVWNALLKIPCGETSTYGKIAEMIGHPKAVRAVGSAVGANPVAWIIPCHRVLRTDGGIGGYRWGLDRKRQMLEDEKQIR